MFFNSFCKAVEPFSITTTITVFLGYPSDRFARTAESHVSGRNYMKHLSRMFPSFQKLVVKPCRHPHSP